MSISKTLPYKFILISRLLEWALVNVLFCQSSLFRSVTAFFAMLENALPKISAKLGKADAGDKIDGQSPFLSKIRSTVVESITFLVFIVCCSWVSCYHPLPDVRDQQPFSSCQEDDALGFSQTLVTVISCSYSLKDLRQTLTDVGKRTSANLVKWCLGQFFRESSRQRPQRVPKILWKLDIVFFARFAKNISFKLTELYELRRNFQ